LIHLYWAKVIPRLFTGIICSFRDDEQSTKSLELGEITFGVLLLTAVAGHLLLFPSVCGKSLLEFDHFGLFLLPFEHFSVVDLLLDFLNILTHAILPHPSH